jgi:hypothetical protein
MIEAMTCMRSAVYRLQNARLHVSFCSPVDIELLQREEPVEDNLPASSSKMVYFLPEAQLFPCRKTNGLPMHANLTAFNVDLKFGRRHSVTVSAGTQRDVRFPLRWELSLHMISTAVSFHFKLSGYYNTSQLKQIRIATTGSSDSN